LNNTLIHIGVGDGGAGGGTAPPQFKYIRALKLGEDLFFRDDPNHIRYKRKILVQLEIFWKILDWTFGQIHCAIPLKLLCSPTDMLIHHGDQTPYCSNILTCH